MNHRRDLAWLLFGLALALRVVWVLYAWSQTGPQLTYDDEKLHWQLATNLVRDDHLISNDGRYAARMPLYPLLLACFASLGGWGVLAARLAQAVFGAVTVAVGYRWTRRVAGPRAAAVAGLLTCCDPFQIFFANLLLSEVAFTLLLVGFVVCVGITLPQPLREEEQGMRGLTPHSVAPRSRAPLGVALLGPALVLTRPAAIALVPLFWLIILAVGGWRRTARPVAGCALVLCAAMVPWGIRNKAVLGSFAWLSTNGGATLYDAQGPQADGSSNQSFLNERPEFRGLDEVTLDRELTRRALDQMRQDPARAVRLAGTKFLRTWSLRPNVAEHRSGPIAYVSAAYTASVLLGALVGLLRHVNRRILHALIGLPVAYFTLVHCVYIGSVRYRIPLMPLLAVGAGLALTGPICRAAARSTPASSR